MTDVVFVSAVRTPMGSFGGTLKDMMVYDLGSFPVREALKRAQVAGDEVDESIIGNCRQAGNHVNPGRTVALKGGCASFVPGVTINKACPAGMKAVSMAVQQIVMEQGNIVLCGGMESMSTIPYMLKGARFGGFKMGDQKLEDGWGDSFDPIAKVSMGMTAENVAEKYGIKREDMDLYAVNSHKRADEARKNGWFDEEIIPVTIPATRKKAEYQFAVDESIKAETTVEKLASLRPAFKKDGMVTAGNACGLTDGSAMLVAMAREEAEKRGVKPLFSIVDFTQTAVEGTYMGEGPGVAIPRVLKRAGMTLKDIDLFEINEAFASQVLGNVAMLNLDLDCLNVHGGAIALGHPTGCSGARIIVSLYYALKRLDKEFGVASICGGGGATMAVIMKRES
ncbi:MAG: thiolase family protein [Deltaproteobacteria bacterium]|nr:thiolase family protein [Candidatus Anaeroferrophillus wilburensis]MBN2888874.1 thiolase family protein [Deltaproteobacteria bacterium]